jgi:RNA polymerase sigma-70 factor (ECF subfamily)
MTPFTGHLLQRLRHLIGVPPGGEITDGQLLERFIAERDEDAFALLLQRHGPMILGVCRRLTGDPHAAEDAFQATFAILVRKAGSISKRDSVASWLYGVAFRTARRMKSLAERTKLHELPAMKEPWQPASTDGASPEVRALIEEEISRLPEKFRAPVVLCYLEGKTNEEAAQQLGWPVGTVKGRLSQARARLQHRLTRRGVTLAGAGAAAFTLLTPAPVPAALAATTMQCATRLIAGATIASATSATVGTVAQEVLRTMWVEKLKMVAWMTLLSSAALVGIGVGTAIYLQKTEQPQSAVEGNAAAASKPAPVPREAPKPQEISAKIKKIDFHHITVSVVDHELTFAHSKETRVVDAKEHALKDGVRSPHLREATEVTLTFVESEGKKVCTKIKLAGN